MTTLPSELLEHPLAELVGSGLLQLEPYPVVAPRTLAALAAVVDYARTVGVKVMPLGTGSSFDASFSLARRELIAVLLSNYRGLEQIDHETVRVRAGTVVQQVVADAMVGGRVTIGGLLADSRHHESGRVRDILQPRLHSLQLVTGTAEVITLRFGNAGVHRDPGLANLVCGSNGRLGIIAALDLQWDGVALADSRAANHSEQTVTAHREACLSRADLVSLFDAAGIFQW